MEESISLVLPVHNVETSLAKQVGHFLEVLTDLSSRFELLIVDNGSTDQTSEIANDLASEFPQVQLVGHVRRQAQPSAVESGVRRASGDVVLVYDEPQTARASELPRLCGRSGNAHLAVARTHAKRRATRPGLVRQMMSWAAAQTAPELEETDPVGVQIIRRKQDESPLANEPEVPSAPGPLQREDRGEDGKSAADRRRPKFLMHVKDFVAGD